MILYIEIDKLLRMIEQEIEYAEAHMGNVDKLLRRLSEAEDRDFLITLASGIADNRNMMNVPLQRAAIVLELTGLLSPKEDIPTALLLRERLELLKAVASSHDTDVMGAQEIASALESHTPD